MAEPGKRGMTPEEIIVKSKELTQRLAEFRSTEDCAVMFVDLAGSTAYKEVHPLEEEWLPRLAFFLHGVTRLVNERGRVVKYIGDEVMAVFEGQDSVANSEFAAQGVIRFCAAARDYELRAKIALDYGGVCFVNFTGESHGGPVILADPQGVTVDRCARILERAEAGVVLCSKEYYLKSVIRTVWKKCGAFKARGLRDKVTVYEMILEGMKSDYQLDTESMTLRECHRRVKELESKLRELNQLRLDLSK